MTLALIPLRSFRNSYKQFAIFAESSNSSNVPLLRFGKYSKPLVTFAETPQRYQSPVESGTKAATKDISPFLDST